MFYLTIGEASKVGALGEVTSHEADAVFDGALFPAVERGAEEGAGTEHGIDELMVGILAAIIVGEGAAQRCWVLRQGAIQGEAQGTGRATWQALQLEVTGLALSEHRQGGGALTGDGSIDFPMARLAALLNRGRTKHKRDTGWNMGFAMLAAVPPRQSFAVGAGELWYQLASFEVEPLVDGLVAEGG